jgi:hypothetical protein
MIPRCAQSNGVPSMETLNTTSAVKVVELKHSLVPKKWGESVRKVDMAECQQVAISLAHAFATDDLARYLLDSDDMAGLSPEDKWKLHVDIFQYIVAAHCLNGEAHVIGPDHEGVALWSVFPLRPRHIISPTFPVTAERTYSLLFERQNTGYTQF